MHKPNALVEFDVRDTLDWDPAIDDARISVKADDGVVTLTGTVPTYRQSLLAARDASTVGGVHDVDNELLVGESGREITDAELQGACEAAIDRDRFVPTGAVAVTVDGGRVTLRGHVRHHYQRRAAEHAVSHVDGVLGIDNAIVISSDPVPGDVARRIHKALKRDALVDDSLIEVTNRGSTVYLDGTVDSYLARLEAVDTAYDAPGVTDVVDRLTFAL